MNIDEIMKEILGSKKYSSMDVALVERVCSETIKKYPKKKDVVKAVKNELHVIHESFLLNDCHKIARSELSAYNDSNLASDREFSLRMMGLHASTKERIAHVDAIYSYLDSFLSSECAIADIGCGFNPFALSFYSHLSKSYAAYEINTETVELLNSYFHKIGQHETYHAETLDAVSSAPKDHADVVFLFKLLPLLQQQKKGRAFELLEELNFTRAVVSFPIKSLSGREKGMEQFYSSFFENGLPERFHILDRKVIGNEMFYVIE